MTIDQFIQKHGIKFSATETDRENKHMSGNRAWAHTNYACTITRDGRRMSVLFSVGSGWTREPSATDVLETLASDASTIENAPAFADWADELGYNTDSRKAESAYKATKRQAESLRRVMGDAYDTLLWETERL